MKTTYTAEEAQRSGCWGYGLLVVLLALCFTGCETLETVRPQQREKSFFADEIRQMDSAEPGVEVEARTQHGNWKFLACLTDAPEATNVPGLTPEEGVEYIDSGLFGTEIFFDHRALYVFQFDGDPKPWVEAKWRYAERANRALLKKIRATGRVSGSLTMDLGPATRPVSK